jgi:glycosyltransferase involved in cell wall biosynthesis
LLILNLATDADDPILGFTSGWIRALASHCDRVDVITMRAGRLDLPQHVQVWSLGKERGYSEPRRAFEFYSALSRIVAARRVDVCFAHMAPLFAVLAAPVLRPLGIPIVTWFAHWRLTNTLRLSHFASRAMVTSLESTYPYRRDKLHVIGQGIDTDLFSPGDGAHAGRPLILCAGRLSPLKDHPTLVRALAVLHRERPGTFEVAVVGGPARADDEAYVRALSEQVRDEGLENVVTFHGHATPQQMPAWYRRATVHVNLTSTGFGDKVALEAMSCGTPCILANADMRTTLAEHCGTLYFQPGDAEDLALRLRYVLSLEDESRRRIGSDLRRQVIERHSLDRLARRVLQIGLSFRRRQDDAVAI